MWRARKARFDVDTGAPSPAKQNPRARARTSAAPKPMKVISHPFCTRQCRSCAADQLYLPWRAARAAGSAVPSSAQQLCLCFLGSRVALFRIGCLVQLQQSLRSLVLLLRMRRLRSQRLQGSVWPLAHSKTVPSSAQRHCFCFLGARVALFRIGWLVQLQLQSLRSIVVLCACSSGSGLLRL